MTLTLKYAFFRKNNAMTGRLIELAFIILAFASIGALLTAEQLHLTLTALVTALCCFAAFNFFNSAEKIRYSIDEKLN